MNNAQETEILSVDDSSPVKVVGSVGEGSPAAVAVSSIVDLTAESSTSDYMKDCSSKYAKETSKAFAPPPKKKQKKRGRVGTQKTTASATSATGRPKSDVDAVDIEKLYQSQASGEGTSSEGVKPPDYRQVLGPLRMGFVDSFATEHNVDRQFGSYNGAPAYYAMGSHKQTTTKAKPASRTTNLQKAYKELTEFQLNLPVEKHSAIYCRALESDLTKVRVAITGPLESPYAAGFFVFDVELHDYPNAAPKVKLLTTGGGRVRFNPNLYQDGKVCLSLLGTWQGPGWIRNKSTLLQVLISIQGLILVNDPYFNEPGYERDRGTARGKAASDNYNRNLYAHTLNYAIVDMILHGATTYPEFYPVIERHFAYHREFVWKKMQEWAKLSSTVKTLIPKVEAALNALPPLVTTKHKRPPRTPETISLIDEDEDTKEDSKPSSRSSPGKAPETIDLIE